MIFIIDDDEIMAECLARAAQRTSPGHSAQVFSNAIEAMDAISAGHVPKMIFLDILLDGPDGFTFLNELISYSDTASIPVIIVSSLDLSGRDLSIYGVVAVLNKDTMTPAAVQALIEQFAGSSPAKASAPKIAERSAHAA